MYIRINTIPDKWKVSTTWYLSRLFEFIIHITPMKLNTCRELGKTWSFPSVILEHFKGKGSGEKQRECIGQKDGVDTLFPISLQSITVNSRIYIYIYIFLNTLKVGEKKTNQLVTLGPREQHDDEFPELSFCLIYPSLDTEQADNSERPINAEKKKSLLSQAKELGKEQSSRTENF